MMQRILFVFCSVRVRPERLEVCVQDGDSIVSGALVTTGQYPVGQYDGSRWSGQYLLG